MTKLSTEDYEVLDSFVLKSLKRLAAGEDDVGEVYADFMHVLTAWDVGNEQEFIPHMRHLLQQWAANSKGS